MARRRPFDVTANSQSITEGPFSPQKRHRDPLTADAQRGTARVGAARYTGNKSSQWLAGESSDDKHFCDICFAAIAS